MASSISSAAVLFAAALLSLLSTPISADDILYSVQSLWPGRSLARGPYLFIMQQDCNLVLYDNNEAVWQSETDGRDSNCVLTLQSDGNLIIHSDRRVIWASNTNRQNGNYYLILQRDRNVVIYDNSNNFIWATGTNIGNLAIVVIPHSNGTATAAAPGTGHNKAKELYP